MADTIQPPGDPKTAQAAGQDGVKPPAGPLFVLRAADIQLYRICDDLSGMLIFPMLVFSPWAFGTTEPWSIWIMSIGGYALGILFLAKIFVRGLKGYKAPRWDCRMADSKFGIWNSELRRARFLTRSLAGLTLAVLAFCLVSALNARSFYNPVTRLFEYRHCIAWLPHSLDVHLLDLPGTGRFILGDTRLAAGNDE